MNSRTEGHLVEGRNAAFTAFCVVWGFTELIHVTSFWMTSDGLSVLGLAFASLILIFRPSRVALLAVSVLDVVNVFVQSPLTANHILFNGFVNLTIGLLVARSLSPRGSRAEVFDAIVP